MATLFDKIRYDYKSYFELTDPIGRQEIELLAEKLKSLENEIVNDPNGQITIMKSGNIFSDSFAPDLSEKITAIIAGGVDE